MKRIAIGAGLVIGLAVVAGGVLLVANLLHIGLEWIHHEKRRRIPQFKIRPINDVVAGQPVIWIHGLISCSMRGTIREQVSHQFTPAVGSRIARGIILSQTDHLVGRQSEPTSLIFQAVT